MAAILMLLLGLQISPKKLKLNEVIGDTKKQKQMVPLFHSCDWLIPFSQVNQNASVSQSFCRIHNSKQMAYQTRYFSTLNVIGQTRAVVTVKVKDGKMSEKCNSISRGIIFYKQLKYSISMLRIVMGIPT